jgi:hypothetical protein
MKAIVKQVEKIVPKKNIDFSVKKQPKIKLGTGRYMAEIDYDAVFGNINTK